MCVTYIRNGRLKCQELEWLQKRGRTQNLQYHSHHRYYGTNCFKNYSLHQYHTLRKTSGSFCEVTNANNQWSVWYISAAKRANPVIFVKCNNHWEYSHHLLCSIDCRILDLGPNLTKIHTSFGDHLKWITNRRFLKHSQVEVFVSVATDRIRYTCLFNHIKHSPFPLQPFRPLVPTLDVAVLLPGIR